MTNDELRAKIPKTGDPRKPFFTRRHEEIDSLLCKYPYTQYELALLHHDILMATKMFLEKAQERKQKKKKKRPETFDDLWAGSGDHA